MARPYAHDDAAPVEHRGTPPRFRDARGGRPSLVTDPVGDAGNVKDVPVLAGAVRKFSEIPVREPAARNASARPAGEARA